MRIAADESSIDSLRDMLQRGIKGFDNVHIVIYSLDEWRGKDRALEVDRNHD